MSTSWRVSKLPGNYVETITILSPAETSTSAIPRPPGCAIRYSHAMLWQVLVCYICAYLLSHASGQQVIGTHVIWRTGALQIRVADVSPGGAPWVLNNLSRISTRDLLGGRAAELKSLRNMSSRCDVGEALNVVVRR